MVDTNVKFAADTKQYVGPVKQATEATKKLGEAVDKTKGVIKKAKKEKEDDATSAEVLAAKIKGLAAAYLGYQSVLNVVNAAMAKNREEIEKTRALGEIVDERLTRAVVGNVGTEGILNIRKAFSAQLGQGPMSAEQLMAGTEGLLQAAPTLGEGAISASFRKMNQASRAAIPMDAFIPIFGVLMARGFSPDEAADIAAGFARRAGGAAGPAVNKLSPILSEAASRGASKESLKGIVAAIAGAASAGPGKAQVSDVAGAIEGVLPVIGRQGFSLSGVLARLPGAAQAQQQALGFMGRGALIRREQALSADPGWSDSVDALVWKSQAEAARLKQFEFEGQLATAEAKKEAATAEAINRTRLFGSVYGGVVAPAINTLSELGIISAGNTRSELRDIANRPRVTP